MTGPLQVTVAQSHIGVVPVATGTHTEPFHVSEAFVTLEEFASRSEDLVSITPADDDSPRIMLAELADVGGTDVKVFADLYVSSSGLSDKRSDTLVAPGSAAELVGPVLRLQRIGLAYREGETRRARLGLPVAENQYQEANRP
jgi:hypothetical protein